jgi:hypothetical protein
MPWFSRSSRKKLSRRSLEIRSTHSHPNLRRRCVIISFWSSGFGDDWEDNTGEVGQKLVPVIFLHANTNGLPWE